MSVRDFTLDTPSLNARQGVLNRPGKKALARIMTLGLLSAGLLTACQGDVSAPLAEKSSPSLSNGVVGFEALKAAAPRDAGDPVAPEESAAESDRLQVEDAQLDNAMTQGWQLSLSADKPNFKLGEPVYLRVSLQNLSAEERDATALLQPEFRQLTYRVIGPEGSEHAFQPIAEFCTLPILAKKTFAPGETVQAELKLFAARGGWTFDTPGDYRVSATFDGHASARGLMSNTLHVVVQPGTQLEQELGGKLMTGQAALLLQWERGDHLLEGLNVLKEVAQQGPGTLQGFYANYVLGNNLAQSFTNGKTERPAQPALALPYLLTAREALYARFDTGMSTHVRENLHLQLVSALKGLNRVAEAKTVAATFEHRYSSDVHMAESIARIHQAVQGL